MASAVSHTRVSLATVVVCISESVASTRAVAAVAVIDAGTIGGGTVPVGASQIGAEGTTGINTCVTTGMRDVATSRLAGAAQRGSLGIVICSPIIDIVLAPQQPHFLPPVSAPLSQFPLSKSPLSLPLPLSLYICRCLSLVVRIPPMKFLFIYNAHFLCVGIYLVHVYIIGQALHIGRTFTHTHTHTALVLTLSFYSNTNFARRLA